MRRWAPYRWGVTKEPESAEKSILYSIHQLNCFLVENQSMMMTDVTACIVLELERLIIYSTMTQCHASHWICRGKGDLAKTSATTRLHPTSKSVFTEHWK